MRASSSASSAGIEICWSTKWDIPAWRAPGTSVSPSASSIAACAAVRVRSATPCARAARGVSRTSVPPTVKASAPIAAPFMKARRSKSCMRSSSPAPDWALLAAVRRPKRSEAAAVFWNNPKIQCRFRDQIKRLCLSSARGSLDLAAEQPFGIAVGDTLGLLFGNLGEPAAVGPHDGVVAEPALVDPSIGSEQESIRMTGEELAPFVREFAVALGNAAAIGELAHQREIFLLEPPYSLRPRREPGVRPDDLGVPIVREQN